MENLHEGGTFYDKVISVYDDGNLSESEKYHTILKLFEESNSPVVQQICRRETLITGQLLEINRIYNSSGGFNPFSSTLISDEFETIAKELKKELAGVVPIEYKHKFDSYTSESFDPFARLSYKKILNNISFGFYILIIVFAGINLLFEDLSVVMSLVLFMVCNVVMLVLSYKNEYTGRKIALRQILLKMINLHSIAPTPKLYNTTR